MLHKKPTVYLSVLGMGAAIALVIRLHGQSPVVPPPVDPAPKPYALSIAASGIIEALSENVAIGVPEQGLVSKVHVSVWDAVEAGQPLFTLDDREIRAQLAVDEAEELVFDATLRRLQDQLARLKGVKDARAVSLEEVRTKENDVAVARAQLATAKAKAGQSRMQLSRLTIRAPRAGSILQVNVRPGEFATVSPKVPAILLGELDQLQVRADVDEQNAGRLQPGGKAKAFVKGDASRSIELRFVRIEPYVVPKVSLTGAATERVDTRVLQVIYSFRRPVDRPVYVGQQVDIYIETDIDSFVMNRARHEAVAAN